MVRFSGQMVYPKPERLYPTWHHGWDRAPQIVIKESPWNQVWSRPTSSQHQRASKVFVNDWNDERLRYVSFYWIVQTSSRGDLPFIASTHLNILNFSERSLQSFVAVQKK